MTNFIDTHCHIDSYQRHAGESFDALLERFQSASFTTERSSAKEKAAALEFALNQGRSRLSGEQVSLEEKDPKTFASMEEILEAWKKQFR